MKSWPRPVDRSATRAQNARPSRRCTDAPAICATVDRTLREPNSGRTELCENLAPREPSPARAGTHKIGSHEIGTHETGTRRSKRALRGTPASVWWHRFDEFWCCGVRDHPRPAPRALLAVRLQSLRLLDVSCHLEHPCMANPLRRPPEHGPNFRSPRGATRPGTHQGCVSLNLPLRRASL